MVQKHDLHCRRENVDVLFLKRREKEARKVGREGESLG